MEASVIGASGWRSAMRPVRDVSLGGIGVRLTRAELKSADIPSAVTVELRFRDVSVLLPSRAVHRTTARSSFFGFQRELGVQFEEVADLEAIRPLLAAYLEDLAGVERRLSA